MASSPTTTQNYFIGNSPSYAPVSPPYSYATYPAYSYNYGVPLIYPAYSYSTYSPTHSLFRHYRPYYSVFPRYSFGLGYGTSTYPLPQRTASRPFFIEPFKFATR